MKYTLKADAPVLKHDGKAYSPGDKVELTKEEAMRVAHHLVEGDSLLGPPGPKTKELDEE